MGDTYPQERVELTGEGLGALYPITFVASSTPVFVYSVEVGLDVSESRLRPVSDVLLERRMREQQPGTGSPEYSRLCSTLMRCLRTRAGHAVRAAKNEKYTDVRQLESTLRGSLQAVRRVVDDVVSNWNARGSGGVLPSRVPPALPDGFDPDRPLPRSVLAHSESELIQPGSHMPVFVPTHMRSAAATREEVLAARTTAGSKDFLRYSQSSDQRKLRTHIVTDAVLRVGHPDEYVRGNPFFMGPFHYGPGRYHDLTFAE